MADIFESTVQHESALEVLVGEGKKFSDAEALARAKIEADRTVADRNRELEEHRQEMNRLREEVLALKASPREPAPAHVPPKEADRPVEEAPNLDLASRIRDELRQVQQQETEEENVRRTQTELVKAFGSLEKAREVVTNKANELGLSIEFLNSVAAKSPKAFLAQIGLTPSETPTAVATRGDVNTSVVATLSSAPKSGTYKFYQDMMKNDSKRYWTPEVQNQIFNDRKRFGEDFYK